MKKLILVLAFVMLFASALGAFAQAQYAAPIAVVNTGNLNVRSGPGPQFSILGSVPGGTVLPVDGVTPDQAWFLVSSPYGAGWVDGEFVVFRGAVASVPILDY